MRGKFWLRRASVVCTAGVVLLFAATVPAEDARTVVKQGKFPDDLLVTGDRVTIEATLEKDLLVSGGRVDVDAKVNGDLFAAGGRVVLGDDVVGSLLAAGGRIDVTGNVGDDVTVVGGRIDLDATIDGDAFVAGGRIDMKGTVRGDLRASGGKITVHRGVAGNLVIGGGRVELRDTAHVEGKAMIGAGTLYVGGRVDKDLRAGARKIVIAGIVEGDVQLAADTITVSPSARIGGDLVYRSPKAIEISDDAQIGGDVTFIQSVEMARRFGGIHAVAGTALLVLILGLILVAAGFVLVAPAVFPALEERMKAKRLKAVGLGLVVLVAGPVVVALLIATWIGLPLALLLAGLYVLAGTIGFLGAAYAVGRSVFGFFKRDLGATPWKRLGATACGLLALGLIAVVPVLGALSIILATALGVGALLLGGLDLRRRQAAES